MLNRVNFRTQICVPDIWPSTQPLAQEFSIKKQTCNVSLTIYDDENEGFVRNY